MLNPTQAGGENTLHETPNHYFSVLSNYWFQVIEYVSVTLCSAILSLSTQFNSRAKAHNNCSLNVSSEISKGFLY